ncbi:unnamed protein product [Amaranthus hypochondriacus]
MSISSSVNPLIFSLIEDGKALPQLLRDAKKPENLPNIRSKLTPLINNILKTLQHPQIPSSCPENVIPKLFDKIQSTLQKFIDIDHTNSSFYQKLVSDINDVKSRTKFSTVRSSSPVVDLPSSGALAADSESTHEALTEDDYPNRDQLGRLDDNEKKCLICFCLFSAGIEVKKREPIHLWIGMDLIKDSIEGADMLAKLVAEGFIERTIGKKKLCNRYNMNKHVLDMVVKDMNIHINDKGSLSILQQKHQLEQPEPQQQPLQHSSSVLTRRPTFVERVGSLIFKDGQDEINYLAGTLVLNKTENMLDARTSDRIPTKRNNIKALHLGIWDNNPKRYIMVEEMDALKGLLKSMGNVCFLSLEGISGIVELPDSVYKLENLKVLDLRGCPNLESLSEGIQSLKQLTHLDLSECYLLDHIPAGIGSLTELRVLKGFVINPEEAQDINENENESENENENENADHERSSTTISSSASFSELLRLKKLMKLTIRTRRMNFPTSNDLDVLNQMEKLTNLKIAWVWSSIKSPIAGASGRFPKSVKKLELQAASEHTMSRLLRLISEDSENSLEKVYIRGGRVRDLGMEMHNFGEVHTVRLRYLPELRIDWDEFKMYFPKLSRLEILGCPNLIFFPCDENGLWEQTYVE